jgi:hypothetical protein
VRVAAQHPHVVRLTQASPPRVAPLGRHLHSADLLVTGTRTLPYGDLVALRRLVGVDAVEGADVGSVLLDGQPTQLMGVNPSTFRGWTPLLTARSDPMWQSIAAGSVAVSFDMGHEARLPLGGVVPLNRRWRMQEVRIGAFATVGIAGIDAIAPRSTAEALGLPHANAFIVSAPRADPLALRDQIQRILGARGRVQLLRAIIVVRNAGEFITNAQIDTVIRAAWTRIGRPYVWGATGPNAFDCSGLVGWAYAQAGISLPLSDAMPGDLLFWTYDPTDPANVDHVALYVGNGLMIVAPHTGEYVQEVPVPTNLLAGIVRVDPAMAAEVGGPRFYVG